MIIKIKNRKNEIKKKMKININNSIYIFIIIRNDRYNIFGR